MHSRATDISMEALAPHMAEKTPTTRIAPHKAGFLPTMSVKRPVKGVMTVWASRYDVPTQAYWEELASNSADICGKDVDTI